MSDAKVYDFERARKQRDELAAIKEGAFARIPETQTLVTGGMQFTYSTTCLPGEMVNGQLPLPLFFHHQDVDSGATA